MADFILSCWYNSAAFTAALKSVRFTFHVLLQFAVTMVVKFRVLGDLLGGVLLARP